MAPPESYEDRCKALAGEFSQKLSDLAASQGKEESLTSLCSRLQADLNLAEYKYKFREADKVKWLAYGPIVISSATLVLALVLAGVSWSESSQKARDAKAGLVRAVLALPGAQREKVLNYYQSHGLMSLDKGETKLIEDLPMLKPE